MADDGLFGDECLAEAVGGLGRLWVCREPFGHRGEHVWTRAPGDPDPADPPRARPVGQVDGPPDFVRFHADHPEVYEKLRLLALEVAWAGHRRTGFRMLWEVLRWQHLGQSFPMNDHHCPHYARLLMAREPSLAGLFEVRPLRPRDE